jgi:S-formylglutathione hydrolase FrmB
VSLLRLTFGILLLTAWHLSAGVVDSILVYSPAMQKPVPCLVIRPDAYAEDLGPYTVVYLLHGWSGNQEGWLREAPQLLDMSDRYGMLIVCPDGGYDSWYFDSPVDSTVRYETFIARELVGYIDRFYNVKPLSSGRAITGLSMGGHGALWLAARHPEVFGAAGSMAGGLDIRKFPVNNWDIAGVLGDPKTHWENWESGAVVNQIPLFQRNKQALIIDCGTEDFFLEANRSMHRQLQEAGVPHEYTERPGKHNGAYWGNAVDHHMLFFYKFFLRSR